MLIIAAVVVVIGQRDQVAAALDAVKSPSFALVAALLGSVIANLGLSSLTFSLLLSRLSPGKVGILEMQALIASTALVNYLPMRPGLFGRIAYHRAVNGVPVLHSTRILIEGAVLTLLAAAALATLALIAHQLQMQLASLAVMPALVILPMMLVAPIRILCMAAFLRYTEVLVWAVRYILVFELIGAQIDATAAAAFASVSILATMVPFVSNGLGLREWLVGLLAPVLAGHRLEIGLAAELLNRSAEVVIVLLTGSIGMVYLAGMRRRKSSEQLR